MHNYGFLLELADFYQMDSVIDKCDIFLKGAYSVSFVQKLIMVDKYGLPETKEACFESSSLENRDFIQGLMKTPEYKEVSAELKNELLEKAIDSFTVKIKCNCGDDDSDDDYNCIDNCSECEVFAYI